MTLRLTGLRKASDCSAALTDGQRVNSDSEKLANDEKNLQAAQDALQSAEGGSG